MSENGPETNGSVVSGRLRRLLTVTAALLLVASVAGTLYVATTEFDTGETYTEFYVLGENRTAADYPTDLAPGEQGSLLVRVSNHENEYLTYRLEVLWDDTTTVSRDVAVSADRTEGLPVTVSAPEQPGEYRLRLLLYRTTESTEPYKTLYLNVEVRGSS